jgi:type IV secretory pathway VirB10-like protein
VPADNDEIKRSKPPTHLVLDTPKPKPVRATKERMRFVWWGLGALLVFVFFYGWHLKTQHRAEVVKRTAEAQAPTEAARSPRSDIEAAVAPVHHAPRDADSAYTASQTDDSPTGPQSDAPPVGVQPERSAQSAYPSQEVQFIQQQIAAQQKFEQDRLQEEEAVRAAPLDANANKQAAPNPPTTNASLQLPPGMDDQPPTGASLPPTGDIYSKVLAALNNNKNPGSERYKEQNDQSSKAGFNKGGALSEEDPYLHTTRQDPVSRYELTQGSAIPATLEPKIKSDLPGDVTAIVSRDVYDSASLKYVLIPQGTRIVGTYNSNVTYAQNALQVAWTLLKFPDGTYQYLDRMMGYDPSGTSGLHDKADSHMGRLIGGMLASSALAAGFQISQRQNNSVLQYPSAGDEAEMAVGQQVSQLGQQIAQRNLNIQPTEIERPGKLFYIKVNRDMVFTGPYTPHESPAN